ncbi:ribokinase [Promicromonospora sp. NPDC052451]|uniref:ribokinase n=1 Tax=Promicromonospora sp. NPDC052451 TaxID=3364407 RepID=UPI0037C5C9E9
MTARVTVVGSVNADTSLRLGALPRPGETVLAREASASLGGKGANQAVAAARAGARVRMVGAVGAADGDPLAAALAAEGIDTDLLTRSDLPSGRALVLLDDAGENSIIVVPGANAALDDDAVRRACAQLVPGDVLVLQHEVPAATSRAAAAAASARGATVIWNAAPAPARAADLVEHVDLLVVNEHELEAVARLLGLGPSGPEGDVAAVAARLGTDVVCTLGAAGALVYRSGALVRVPAPAVTAVDTTAAGDTFVGYLAASWHLPAADAVRRAVVAGALAVTRPGATPSIPALAEVEPRLATASSKTVPAGPRPAAAGPTPGGPVAAGRTGRNHP